VFPYKPPLEPTYPRYKRRGDPLPPTYNTLEKKKRREDSTF
jgi:hypothetical protein